MPVSPFPASSESDDDIALRLRRACFNMPTAHRGLRMIRASQRAQKGAMSRKHDWGVAGAQKIQTIHQIRTDLGFPGSW